MPRKYDSSRRAEAARQTRNQILDAAVRLHGEGILDIESLAREAGVSVATVRKHFPTREILFENCTAHGVRFAPLPDIEAIRAIDDGPRRIERAVREVYSFHESLLGQTWMSYLHEYESPALSATLKQLQGLIGQVINAALDPNGHGTAAEDDRRPLLLAMLSPLTYRALRVHGGLSPAEAIASTATMLLRTVGSDREEGVYR